MEMLSIKILLFYECTTMNKMNALLSYLHKNDSYGCVREKQKLQHSMDDSFAYTHNHVILFFQEFLVDFGFEKYGNEVLLML